MDNITWRTVRKRGVHADGDISLSLTKHTGRLPQLRIGIFSAFMKSHDYNYVAISELTESEDKIYFMFSKERLNSACQNKLAQNGSNTTVLFSLNKSEVSYIEKWCGKAYPLKQHEYTDVFYIERSTK